MVRDSSDFYGGIFGGTGLMGFHLLRQQCWDNLMERTKPIRDLLADVQDCAWVKFPLEQGRYDSLWHPDPDADGQYSRAMAMIIQARHVDSPPRMDQVSMVGHPHAKQPKKQRRHTVTVP
jgi:hypothetical protein